MVDPFPQFTSALENILLYLIFIGIILATISGIFAGIMYLPIFGWLDDQKNALGRNALRMTVIGLLIILIAIPARNAILSQFTLPPGVPAIPLSTPAASPTPRVQG